MCFRYWQVAKPDWLIVKSASGDTMKYIQDISWLILVLIVE